MKQEVRDIPKKEGQDGVEEVAPKELYDLHIKIEDEWRQKLKDQAELAHKLGLIGKPDLVDIITLYISWGTAVLKKTWLDRMGYR